ncbi:hypothetical protein ABES80_01700 [Bacillus gobiensis]|uniref:hypothetical protein n=1 Tax=Bacillus gobiensis TaxID=1441095 RepID=UPI003D2388FC
MTVLLDARTSQNASFSNSISVPVLAGTQSLFGIIGLGVSDSTSPIRVQLNGTIAVQLPLLPVATTITIRIVRGTAPTDPLVYSSSEALNLAIAGPQLLTFIASDFNVAKPASGLLVYTAFITSNVVGAVRVGPESLNGIAYSD